MKIVATSCCKLQSTQPQPVWAEIQALQPDALLLMGDNIYLDHDHHSDSARLGDELAQLYRAQLAEPNFAALLTSMRQRKALVSAIYDDHDFIGNNRYGGDVSPALREAARSALIEAFRPTQTGGDVYRVHRTPLVDIVVLDARFYRHAPSICHEGRDGMLGARQWQWFEQVVQASVARYLMVVSSTTFHTFGDESWEQYPQAFDRMRQLLAARAGAFIVSGDVHRNALYDDSGVIEVVTSAVARNGIVFGSPRKNYGVFTFTDDAMRVELRSLKSAWRFDVTVPRQGQWALP
ncbi:MAG: alkaline phosphatase D family protein [Zoogloea sp.]|nr:alkaline phosphatase D family protein [Zoogloea sp.]